MPSVAPRTVAISSDSAELCAIVPWVFDHDFTQQRPTMATPPLVDFRAVLQPAQLASVKMSMTDAQVCHEKWTKALGRPKK